MASNRSSEHAPADDQAVAETFDEEKAANPAEIQRPDRDKEDDRVQPVDAALTGARGERFGGAVASDADDPDPDPDSDSDPDSDPADRDDPDRKTDRTRQEDKLDEAIEESFPASDPPPLRPGSGR